MGIKLYPLKKSRIKITVSSEELLSSSEEKWIKISTDITSHVDVEYNKIVSKVEKSGIAKFLCDKYSVLPQSKKNKLNVSVYITMMKVYKSNQYGVLVYKRKNWRIRLYHMKYK